MVAVVTGAAGFIGSHLVGYLVAHQEQTKAVIRPGSRSPLERGPFLEIVEADLARGLPREVLLGATMVYHCAAQVRPAGNWAMYHRNTVVATKNLLQALASAGHPRLVYLSSAAVHGEHVDHVDADEAAPYAAPPPDPYVAAKIEAEKAVLQASRAGDVPVTILRPGWIFGPGDEGLRRIAMQLRRGFFPLPGQGSPLLHLGYVENLVEAAALAGSSDEGCGEVFLLHDDAGLSAEAFLRGIATAMGHRIDLFHLPGGPFEVLAGVVEACARSVGIAPPVTRYQVAILRRRQGFVIEKAKRLLGFRPRVSMEEAFRRTARWALEMSGPNLQAEGMRSRKRAR